MISEVRREPNGKKKAFFIIKFVGSELYAGTDNFFYAKEGTNNYSVSI